MQVPRKILKSVYAVVPKARTRILQAFALAESVAERERAAGLGLTRQAQWGDISRNVLNRTVFVLGSGWSIRNLDDARLDIVRQQASFALNAWPVHHEFVATYFLVETTTPSIWEALQTVINHRDCRGILAAQFLDHGHSKSASKITAIPPSLMEKTYLYTSLSCLGVTKSSYRANIAALLQAPVWSESVTIGPRSTSVERAVVLAAAAGARDIVLCGIDLRGPYFYEEAPNTNSHSTNSGASFRKSVSRRIVVLADVLRTESKAKLFVSDPIGELAGHLPSFRWPTRTVVK